MARSDWPATGSEELVRPDGSRAKKRRFETQSLFLLASIAADVHHPSAGSQFFQDEAIFQLVFNNQGDGPLKRGRFVEFGASDGFYNSNTIFFERAFGWEGLLLEGDPELVEQARRVRPRATVLNQLVGFFRLVAVFFF